MDCKNLNPLFNEILSSFGIRGKITDITYIGTGNINDTYSVKTAVENGEREYILQRVNHRVFRNPEHIAENVCRVTGHIETKLRATGITDIRRRVLRYYRKPDGAYFHITDEGNYWRMLSCVYDAKSIDRADIPHLRSAGTAFGEFQNYLSDFPAHTLHEIIPDFHNTQKRYNDLRAAAERDEFGRLSEVTEEYNYLMSMEREATILCRLNAEGILPNRVVHNDTKCNNVMFDNATGEHLAVIDLDTVMPGLVACDFGDAVRFAANPGGEDNEDISKVYLDTEFYSAFASGFVPCLLGKVTEKEIETLPDGVLAITLELASRFLTDYLEGDVYFKCKKPFHNLIRTRAQIALAKDIFGKMPELRLRLESITNKLQQPVV